MVVTGIPRTNARLHLPKLADLPFLNFSSAINHSSCGRSRAS